MAGTLARVFKRKMVIAALGAAFVVGAGTTAALAAAGNQAHNPLVAQGQSSQSRSHDGADDNNRSTGAARDSRRIEGAIRSLDAGNSTFVVASEHNGDVTVTVTAQTAFDDGVSDFADLKVGMFVEVNGNFQTDNTVTATRIERGSDVNDANDANDAPGAISDDRSGADEHHGGGSGGPGRGGHGGHDGHDDGVPHT
jgi:hypothetical protein